MTEIRAAWHDTRRHPVLLVLGFVAVCAGVCWWRGVFDWVPAGVAVAAQLGLWMATAWMRRSWIFFTVRRRVRHWVSALIWLGVLLDLIGQAGPFAWGLAAGLWLIVAGLTDTIRARRRVLAWIAGGVAASCRVDIATLRPHRARWEGRHLLSVEFHHGPDLRSEEQASRDRVANAVEWRLRPSGPYRVEWPPGQLVFTVTGEPPLPSEVADRDWPENLPGIPIGVTSTEEAHAVYEERDETGRVLETLPLVLLDPAASERHLLIVGGTGAGKSVFTRGLIRRAVVGGWYPGGVTILDGKSSADYIVFEHREGIDAVAREPEEWLPALERAISMMEQRYAEDADYQRGAPKPDHPRFMLVLEEVQEIRATLGKDVFDPLMRRLARQIRASNGRLVLVTQRPDAEEAIPTVVRDMLEDRVILGFVSGTGARMVLDADWRTVVDEYGASTTPGRGMARISGRLIRLQSFWLPTPRTVPEVEELYPPQRAESHGSASDTVSGGPVSGGGVDPDAPTPPTGIPVTGPPPAGRRPGRRTTS